MWMEECRDVNVELSQANKVKKTTKLFLKSPMKIEKIPGKTLEFYVESCVGTLILNKR
jgi:hypothetical protein